MRNALPIAGMLLLPLCGVALANDTTVLTAARIHTMDADRPVATAMAYDDAGRILALGDAATLGKRYPDAKRLAFDTATVIPGLIDAHGHVGDLGLSRLGAELTGARDQAEVLARLRAFAVQLPAGEWLVGSGWDQNDWPDSRLPTAADLDAAFPDRPVWLSRIDGHAGWANSAALRLVQRDLSGNWQPPGGRIERDADGKPTGVFVDAAMGLVEDVRPRPGAEVMRKALALGMAEAVRYGLTGVHDAGVPADQVALYRQMADADQLPLRIYAMARGDDATLDAMCANGAYAHPGGRLRLRAVKLVVDGALGSRGAALLADYSDDPGNRGLLLWTPGQLRGLLRKARDCNVQVAAHAIGDAANREVLDAFATEIGSGAAAGARRWRIEHAQVLAPEDLPRLARQQVIASVQPTHATSDMPWAQQRVGDVRIRGAYAWQSLRRSGARLALGSDFPVESAHPRLGLHAAATRADASGKPPGGWFPGQRLTVEQALRGFTIDAAYAGFAEQDVGSLAVGKRADFVVLAEDPLAIPAQRLRELTVLATHVDGRPVYRAAQPAAAP